jgi:hypothetical protein
VAQAAPPGPLVVTEVDEDAAPIGHATVESGEARNAALNEPAHVPSAHGATLAADFKAGMNEPERPVATKPVAKSNPQPPAPKKAKPPAPKKAESDEYDFGI